MKFEYVDVGKYFSGSSPTLLAAEAVVSFIKHEIIINSPMSYATACEILAHQLALNGITHLRILVSHEFTSKDDLGILVDALANSEIQSLFISKGQETDVAFLQSHAVSSPLILATQTSDLSKAILEAAMKAGLSAALISERTFISGERLYCFTLLHNPSLTLFRDDCDADHLDPDNLKSIPTLDTTSSPEETQLEHTHTLSQETLEELMRVTFTHPSQTKMLIYKQISEDLGTVKIATTEERYPSRLTPQEIETRREQRIMKRISTYASSLHGASSCFNLVLRAEPANASQKATSGKKRTSAKPSKADIIRQENEKRLRDADISRQQKVLAAAVEMASTGRTLDAKLAALEGLRLDRQSSMPPIFCSLVVEKIRIFAEAWKGEVFRRSSDLATSMNDADFSIAVDLFEALFSIIDDEELMAAVTPVQIETVLLPALAMYGFADAGRLLIDAWGRFDNSKGVEKRRASAETALTRATREVAKYKVRHSFVRFQLLFCGHLGDRGSRGPADPRVRFRPDPWQQQLLDVVDERSSALICAPTASGKTFICYYAMEQTLRRSDTGVVLYIAPNKALMDQVVADVYARFNHKQYPKGSARRLFGYLTDVDAFHAFDAQIVVTFPEVVERFIMSPLYEEWRSHIEWVILDEIHTIGEEGKSSSWEKLLLSLSSPILALSATIGNKREFYSWLSQLQKAAEIPCRMIDHLERYSDLQYHFYEPGVADVSSPIIMGLSTNVSSYDAKGEAPSETVTSLRRQAPKGGKVLLLHPLLSLSYEDLITGRELPSDFYLLPGDAVRLWDALWTMIGAKDDMKDRDMANKSSAKAKGHVVERLEALNYEKLEAFRGQLRLTRASMRLYVRQLMALVETFVREAVIDRASYVALQKSLGADVLSADSSLRRHLERTECDVKNTPTDSASAIDNSAGSKSTENMVGDVGVEAFLKRTAVSLLAALGSESRLPAIIFHFDRFFCTQLAVHIIEALEHAEAVKRQRSSREDRHAQTQLERSQRSQRRTRDQDKKTSQDSWIEESVEMESMTDFFAALARNQGPDPELVFYDQRWKVSDEELRKMLEENGVARSMTTPTEKILLRGIFRGIGVHHQGLPKRYLAIVEHLFRLRHLQVVVAGATLALGINMPVRTVVFGASSTTPLSLTPLDFRQAAGRAGRRNYDAIGHVVFWGFAKQSIDALLTSKIPSIRGDVATLDVAAVLQVYHLALPCAALFLTRALTAPLSALGTRDSCFRGLDKHNVKAGGCGKNVDVGGADMFRRMAMALERLGLLDARTLAPTIYARLTLLAPGHGSAAAVVGHLMRLGWIDLICSDYHQRPDVVIRELLLFLCRFVQHHYLPAATNTIKNKASISAGDVSRESSALPILAIQGMQQRLEADLVTYNTELLALFDVKASSLCFAQGALLLDAAFAAAQTVRGVQGVGLLHAIPPNVVISGYVFDYFLHADIVRIDTLHGISEMALWRHLNDFKTFLFQLHQMVQREHVASQSSQQAVADLASAFDRRFRLMWA